MRIKFKYILNEFLFEISKTNQSINFKNGPHDRKIPKLKTYIEPPPKCTKSTRKTRKPNGSW